MSFIHPSTILVCGPTGCGKSIFVSRFIFAHLLYSAPNKIIWVYNEWQPLYDYIRGAEEGAEIEFVKGGSEEVVSNIYEGLDARQRNLLVLDDQMHLGATSNTVQTIFTQGSHHRNLSVIYLVQNMFQQGRAQRTISLNAHYIILFKNPRDKTQIGVLARQMFPTNWQFMIDAFEHATRKPYGYLVLDLRPETPEEYRLKTKVFPGQVMAVYIPDKKPEFKK